MLKTLHYAISHTDLLPDVIDFPLELIESLTEKLAINNNGTNLNDVFKWVSLGKEVLKKYAEMSNHEIQKFRSALAWVLLDMSEAETALEIANTVIKSLENIKEKNVKVVSSYYRLLSSAQNSCGDYKNAIKNITKAIAMDEDFPNNYCVMGQIFINENEFENAENTLKKSLEKSIKQDSEDSPHTASIYQSYSWFYRLTGQDKKSLEYAEKAYEIMKKHLGEENLYSARCLAYWGIYLFCKRHYKKALEKEEKSSKILATIFDERDKEVRVSKENTGRTLVKMDDYEKAFKYFENVVFITNNTGILLALSYCTITMSAPELVCIINNKQISDEIIEKNNIECFEHDILAKALYNECEFFDTIPEKYWEEVAKIYAKKNKNPVLQFRKTEKIDDRIAPNDPILIELGFGLLSSCEPTAENNLQKWLPFVRKQIKKEFGIEICKIRIIDNLFLDTYEYCIKINDVICGKYTISQINNPTAERAGYTITDAITIIRTHLHHIITENIDKVFSEKEKSKK
jgi:tetratricopeptide (TPR) repeat protein